MKAQSASATVDAGEIERFSRLAEKWWDAEGPFRPLHRINSLRLLYLRDSMAAHFGRNALSPSPLEGLRVLDIGCGGGLVAEPLARLGAYVVGIDASDKNIEVARWHAEQSGLAIDYRHASAEDVQAARESFDVVLALEVIEHVAGADLFIECCAALTRPGGIFIGSTINRTAKAFALAVVGAEYVLRWLPRGTHDWQKFLRPSEFAALLRRHGLKLKDMTGMAYRPLRNEWVLDAKDVSVNYLIAAARE